MGREEKTTTVQQAQETRPEPTAEERELNQLQLERFRAGQEGFLQTQQLQGDILSALLGGGELPGNLQSLSGGLSEEDINLLAERSVRDIPAALQAQGILESGIGQELTSQAAAETRLGARQFNLGIQQNLLSQALGGAGGFAGQGIAQAGTIGSQLAGLRPVSTTGSRTQEVSSPNPFLSSFQQSLGKTFGSPSFESGPFTF